LKIYLNGTIQTTTDLSSINNMNSYPVVNYNNNCPFRIGSYTSADNTTPSALFNGQIDAFNAWNRVLTQSEITELYNSGNGKQYPYVVEAPSSLLTSLYAIYKGENNANDSLGNYSGTPQGGLTYTAGKSGNAFTFNGTTAYVALPTNSMNFEQSFSVSAWVYSSVSLATKYFPILSNVQADSWFNNPTGWWFEIYGNEVRVYILNHTNTYNSTTYAYAPGFNTSTWINVTFTRGVSGSTKIYINGTNYWQSIRTWQNRLSLRPERNES
jgi:hypothetical protein